jgi:Na+/H+ antiporter NhaC
MSLLFYLCVFMVLMVAGIVLWNIAQGFNVIASVEKFIRSIFDLQKFKFRPMVVLQSSFVGGLVLVLLGTGANVLGALLYNLISDVVGGVQFIVLEETGPVE